MGFSGMPMPLLMSGAAKLWLDRTQHRVGNTCKGAVSPNQGQARSSKEPGTMQTMESHAWCDLRGHVGKYGNVPLAFPSDGEERQPLYRVVFQNTQIPRRLPHDVLLRLTMLGIGWPTSSIGTTQFIGIQASAMVHAAATGEMESPLSYLPKEMKPS